MKVARAVILGSVIWGMTLLWPNINQLLTPSSSVRFVLALGAILLIDEVVHHLRHQPESGGHHHSKPIVAGR